MTKKSNFDLQEHIISDSVFTIGSVSSVKGKDIIVKVNKDKNLPHLFFKGKTIKNVSVGLSNYVKIVKGFTEIICKVEGEYLEEDRYQVAKRYTNEKDRINRYLNVSVFGFYDGDYKFQHGVKEMPLIGSECKLLSRDEFESLHQLSNGTELSVPLGSLVDEETQNISIAVKRLFAGHIGIFGNTGSGKSNTLAKMYTELFRLKDLGGNFTTKSKFIFVDFNGEYSRDDDDHILTNNKTVYHLKTRISSGDKYPIHKSEIEKLELLSILLDATEKTQQPFLYRAIDRDWYDDENNTSFAREVASIEGKIKKILTKNDIGFNKPFLDKFIKDFERLGFEIIDSSAIQSIGYNSVMKGYYYPNSSQYINDSNIDNFFDPTNGIFKVSLPNGLTDLQKIQFKIFDEYYYEIIEGYANQEHINPLMGRVSKRFSMLEKVFNVISNTSTQSQSTNNIEIINLRDVNLEIKKVIPMLICKASYDEQKDLRVGGQTDNSLHIIIDEAHNILSDASARESDSWKDYRLETFEEIIKEGRKFGTFMTIASQRPSDISTTIISQLHNYFIHKLMNDNDLLAIKRAVAYLDRLSFDSISNLSTGCCFIAGQMTQFPLSVKVALLKKDEQPQSETIDLDELWRKQNAVS